MLLVARVVDYHDIGQQEELLRLLDEYARDQMGQGEALGKEVELNLLRQLARREDAFSVIAYKGAEAVGLANCFIGFSTFKCRPLVNIHDLMVTAAHRGNGISTLIMRKVEAVARQRGCCKLTLEVLQANKTAQIVYRGMGFAANEFEAEQGQTLFWQKNL